MDIKTEAVESLSPRMALASGKQVYEIFTDKPKNPQILMVEVDPLDVEMGQEQTITVKIESKETDAITEHDSVVAVVNTDNKSSTVKFKLTKAEGETTLITYWRGIWERDDSYNDNYVLNITAKNVEGENSVDVTFR